MRMISPLFKRENKGLIRIVTFTEKPQIKNSKNNNNKKHR